MGAGLSNVFFYKESKSKKSFFSFFFFFFLGRGGAGLVEGARVYVFFTKSPHRK